MKSTLAIILQKCCVALLLVALWMPTVTILISPATAYAQSTQSPPTSTGGAAPTAAESATEQEATNKVFKPVGCSTWALFLYDLHKCFGRSVSVYVATTMIYFAGWVLDTSAVLFNATMEITVKDFNNKFYQYVHASIQTVWTIFRDIGNILIIGMFTMIALQMILGVEGFNARKRVAQVLVVAVLINFSLVFARVVIEGSNLVARQFYNATAGITASDSASTQTTTAYETGIAGRFAAAMGVAGTLEETQTTLNKVAQNPQNGGFVALTMGIMTGFVFLATAAVFAYASFLLIVRAILFIIILATSSLAFASYLLPKSVVGNYGFSQWRDALVRNAIFAPLLLIMLWATLTMAEGLQRVADKGKLGGLLNNPASGGHINALFSYLVILGMLYASIKISSSFATKTTGFRISSMIPGFALGQLGRATGLLGRNTVGYMSASASDKLASEARMQGARGNRIREGLLNMSAQGFKNVAKRDMNLANTSLAKQLTGMSGLKGTLAGQTKTGGFLGQEDRMKKRAMDKAQNMALTEREVDEFKSKAIAGSRETHKNEADNLKTEHEETQKEIASLKSIIEKHSTEKDSIHKEIQSLDEERKNHDIEYNLSGSEKAKNERDRVEKLRSQKSSDLQQQAQRISEAEKRMESLVIRSQDIRNNHKLLEEKMQQTARELMPKGYSLDGKYSRDEQVRKIAPDIALNRITNAPFVALGLSSKESDRVAKSMDKLAQELREQKGLRQLVSQIDSTMKDGNAAIIQNQKIAIRDAQKNTKATEHIASEMKDMRAQNDNNSNPGFPAAA